jgi:5' nucleotidase, deoxy (Pyrimidine), cytosolic type C protein (NT5C)
MNSYISIAWDLDGVLADLNGSYRKLFGEDGTKVPKDVFWRNVSNTPRFYENLDPIPEMLALFKRSRDVFENLRVITGLPRKNYYPTAEAEKRTWVRKYLGSVDVVCCASADKQKHIDYLAKKDVLIDDRLDNCTRWTKSSDNGFYILVDMEDFKALSLTKVKTLIEAYDSYH